MPRHVLLSRTRESLMQAFSIVVRELLAGIGSTNFTLEGSLATTTQISFFRNSAISTSLIWFRGIIIIGFIIHIIVTTCYHQVNMKMGRPKLPKRELNNFQLGLRFTKPQATRLITASLNNEMHVADCARVQLLKAAK